MQGASKKPPELSSDVQHVHLTTSHHHSDQGVVISTCTLQQKKKNHIMTLSPMNVCDSISTTHSDILTSPTFMEWYRVSAKYIGTLLAHFTLDKEKGKIGQQLKNHHCASSRVTTL